MGQPAASAKRAAPQATTPAVERAAQMGRASSSTSETSQRAAAARLGASELGERPNLAPEVFERALAMGRERAREMAEWRRSRGPSPPPVDPELTIEATRGASRAAIAAMVRGELPATQAVLALMRAHAAARANQAARPTAAKTTQAITAIRHTAAPDGRAPAGREAAAAPEGRAVRPRVGLYYTDEELQQFREDARDRELARLRGQTCSD